MKHHLFGLASLLFIVLLAACSQPGDAPILDQAGFAFEVASESDMTLEERQGSLNGQTYTLECDSANAQYLNPLTDLKLTSYRLRYLGNKTVKLTLSFENTSAYDYADLTFEPVRKVRVASSTEPDVIAELASGEATGELEFIVTYTRFPFVYVTLPKAVVLCEDDAPDADDDGVIDSEDNCPAVANALQENRYGSEAGDACEDLDEDGVLDVDEEHFCLSVDGVLIESRGGGTCESSATTGDHPNVAVANGDGARAYAGVNSDGNATPLPGDDNRATAIGQGAVALAGDGDDNTATASGAGAVAGAGFGTNNTATATGEGARATAFVGDSNTATATGEGASAEVGTGNNNSGTATGDGATAVAKNGDDNTATSTGVSTCAGNGDDGETAVNEDLCNRDPMASDDSYTTDEDALLTVPAGPGVLVNDTDSNSDLLTVTLLQGPANGAVELDADGSFDYLPLTDFNGTDSFTYTVDDGNGGTDTATVTITVDPVNDAPSASAGGTYLFATLVTGFTALNPVGFVDVDSEDVVTAEITAVSQSGDGAGVLSDTEILGLVSLSTSTIIPAGATNGSYGVVFELDNSPYDFLAAGETLSLSFTIVATDSAGATATGTFIVQVAGV